MTGYWTASLHMGIVDLSRDFLGGKPEMLALALLTLVLNWASLSACLLYLLLVSLFVCFVYMIFSHPSLLYCMENLVFRNSSSGKHTGQQNERLNSSSAWIARVTFLCSASQLWLALGNESQQASRPPPSIVLLFPLHLLEGW